MNTLTRTIISAPGAFVITTGLALIMAKMIYVPFVDLPDKPEKISFTVNPEIIEVAPIKNNRPQKLEKVTLPPPPPITERPTPTLPSGPIVDSDITTPDFGKIELGSKTFTLLIADDNERAIWQFPPIMPARAERSGHCDVRFNLTAQGQPFEIVTTSCSQAIFKRPTIKAVQKWKYNPKILDGIAVARQGVETRITFNLTDERGFLIPE